jgi:hypothetical protein
MCCFVIKYSLGLFSRACNFVFLTSQFATAKHNKRYAVKYRVKATPVRNMICRQRGGVQTVALLIYPW